MYTFRIHDYYYIDYIIKTPVVNGRSPFNDCEMYIFIKINFYIQNYNNLWWKSIFIQKS